LVDTDDVSDNKMAERKIIYQSNNINHLLVMIRLIKNVKNDGKKTEVREMK
jgi:hypothetical protein